ncbi:MAG: hypothetical protein NTU85_03480 [Candidatus Kaiserbacteria bacterium]|nr:hypothetical protein [Candidatus Kaiserbacteria bacterium]
MTAGRTVVREYLAGDAALMALLPGGLFADVGEISRQTTPGAFDTNGELRPCGLVSLETQIPAPPFDGEGAGARQFFTVNVYDRATYATIDAALDEVFVRLQMSKAAATSGVWEIRHAEDSPEVEDGGLGAKLRYSRWVMWRRR